MENEVQFKINDKGEGLFYIEDFRKQIGRMDVKISDKTLTALHTEVNPAYEGNGLAKRMFLQMVDYARENNLKVKSLCHYVKLQFKKHPGKYTDVLN